MQKIITKMGKGTGTTKYAASSAHSSGEFSYVRTHAYPPTEYINALSSVRSSLLMKDDGEHIKVKTLKGEVRNESVDRLGAVAGDTRVLSFMDKELQKGPVKLTDNFRDRGTVKKVKGGYLYDPKNGYETRTKTLEAMVRYLSPRADYKINGTWASDIKIRKK